MRVKEGITDLLDWWSWRWSETQANKKCRLWDYPGADETDRPPRALGFPFGSEDNWFLWFYSTVLAHHSRILNAQIDPVGSPEDETLPHLKHRAGGKQLKEQ